MKSSQPASLSRNEQLRKVIKRGHYPLEIMLACVRWHSAHLLSLCHRQEMMVERGALV